jgi:D-serine deaminase-like pyridoxal phosphate-dependent protein
MDDLALHGALIGAPRGRASLNTPVLVVDLDALDRNIARMAAFAAEHGVALRPHAKTHKSVDIGRRQLAAGAVGLCCAKLGEAEALAEGGLDGLHLTSPVVTPQAIARLVRLNERLSDLMVVVDNPDNAHALARAVARTERTLDVIIDIDPGIMRTGVSSPEAAVALARTVAGLPALRLRGVQCYCGAEQHIEGYADRREAIHAKTDYLRQVIAALTDAGFRPEIVTGGGTGTHRIDVEEGVFTELQVGSYVFMDSQYDVCALIEEGANPFETSLLVDTRVISANSPMLVTVDGGFKAFATEAGAPQILAGAPQGSMYAFMGDEHGAVVPPYDANERPGLGDRVTFAAPHCDPTVNLYDHYHVVRDEELVAIWPVSARGRSR